MKLLMTINNAWLNDMAKTDDNGSDIFPKWSLLALLLVSGPVFLYYDHMNRHGEAFFFGVSDWCYVIIDNIR